MSCRKGKFNENINILIFDLEKFLDAAKYMGEEKKNKKKRNEKKCFERGKKNKKKIQNEKLKIIT